MAKDSWETWVSQVQQLRNNFVYYSSTKHSYRESFFGSKKKVMMIHFHLPFFVLPKVSWLKRSTDDDVPNLLTFGETVYVKDRRVSIRQMKGEDDDWILDILHTKSTDEGFYECQISTEPPQIYKIFLSIEGKR